MLAEDVEHYLYEVARVLKTGGRCPISFFLLNEMSVALMRSNKSAIDLNINLGSCWVANTSRQKRRRISRTLSGTPARARP